MKKKILAAWILTLSMLCTVILPAQAAQAEYTDVKGHYAQKAIETWSDYGVLKGYPDGTFQPNGTVTRAEFAVVLDRIMGYRRIAENTFTDLSEDQWYTRPILRLVAEGVFTQQAGAMEPNQLITRQETFAALARFFALEESEKATGFTDDSAIAAANRGFIAAMKEAGYIQGDGDGSIRPNDSLTRAELVTMLSRMIAGLANTKGTYSQDCRGTMVVNEGEVTLKNMTIDGDLIVGDGAANSDVYLNGVTVKGDVVLRGCGENSFHIGAGSQVNKIIVNKPANGGIRVVNETDKTIPLVEVKENAGTVILVGNLQTVAVTSGTEVTLKGSVNKLSVTAPDAKINVDEEAEVVSLVTDTAARVNNKGKISSVKAQADGLVLDGNSPSTVTTVKGVAAPVDAKGNKVVASGSSSSGSSRGSGSTSSSTTAKETPLPEETRDPGAEPTPPAEPAPTPGGEPTSPVEPAPAPADCKHTQVEPVEEACKPATCVQAGRSVARCQDCGEEIMEEIPALGHDYDGNGVCTRCGATRSEEDLPDENTPQAGTPFDQNRSTELGLAVLLAMGTAVLLLWGGDRLQRKRQKG